MRLNIQIEEATSDQHCAILKGTDSPRGELAPIVYKSSMRGKNDSHQTVNLRLDTHTQEVGGVRETVGRAVINELWDLLGILPYIPPMKVQEALQSISHRLKDLETYTFNRTDISVREAAKAIRSDLEEIRKGLNFKL